MQKIEVIRGKETKKYIETIAKLRIENFRDYPYAYDGDMKYEKKYLNMYQNSNDSLFVLAKEGNKVVGAITGMPLHEADDDCTEIFLEKNIPVFGIYYVGEIMVLPEYREHGTGHLLWTEFENQVRNMPHHQFHQMMIRELQAPKKDPKRPKNYRPIDDFLKEIGFVQHPELVSYSAWKEIGAAKETRHALVNWLKELKAA